MGKWLFGFLIFSMAAFGGEVQLKDRLGALKNGDYIVTETGKTATIVAIRQKTPTSLILEEISAPLQNLKPKPASWADWVRSKAPGHTSWSMVEIDLETGRILECYSFSRSAWIRLSPQESLFSTLLRLPLKPIDSDKQRRVGPPPQPGEMDHRKIWNPPLVFEGREEANPRFDVFTAEWPEDGTEMSRKTVSLYFDREQKFFFPFWIQVEAAHGTASLRVIDSGKSIPSPFASLPRRIPEFIGSNEKTENGIRLSLKSPRYYQQFELFAIDITGKEKQLIPIPYSLVWGNEEQANLDIDGEELKDALEPNHKYKWLLVPAGYSGSYTESPKPFVWNGS